MGPSATEVEDHQPNRTADRRIGPESWTKHVCPAIYGDLATHGAIYNNQGGRPFGAAGNAPHIIFFIHQRTRQGYYGGRILRLTPGHDGINCHIFHRHSRLPRRELAQKVGCVSSRAMNELLDCRWRGRHDRKTIAPFGFELRLDKSQYPVLWRVRYTRHSHTRSIFTRDADRSVFNWHQFPLHCDQHVSQNTICSLGFYKKDL